MAEVKLLPGPLALADEKWRGADQCTIVDLPHEEVRHVRTADGAELPVLWRGEDAVAASCGAVRQQAWSHDGPIESRDPTRDFRLGGWVVPYMDQVFGQAINEMFGQPFELLLGRKTYEIFAAHWPYAEGSEDDFIAKRLQPIPMAHSVDADATY